MGLYPARGRICHRLRIQDGHCHGARAVTHAWLEIMSHLRGQQRLPGRIIDGCVGLAPSGVQLGPRSFPFGLKYYNRPRAFLPITEFRSPLILIRE
jgi:hypothetical protein